jgi:hypothetical protein
MKYALLLLKGLIVNPQATLAQVRLSFSFKKAILVMILCSLLNEIGWLGGQGGAPMLHLSLGICFVLLFLPVWVMNGGMWHIMANLMGGDRDGKFLDLLKLTAFSSYISVVAVPFSIAETATDGAGFLAGLAMLVLFCLNIWQAVLNIMSIREVYKISGFQSAIVYIMPFMFLVMLAAIFTVLLVMNIGWEVFSSDTVEGILDGLDINDINAIDSMEINGLDINKTDNL